MLGGSTNDRVVTDNCAIAGVQTPWSQTSRALCFFVISWVPWKVLFECSAGYFEEGGQA
jgi:hypothetical protein